VMVGRFSEEKRYHWVIGEVMPRLLREVPGARLRIFGGAGTRTALSYMGRLRELMGRMGLGNAVELIPDAPRSAINGAMDRSRAFLHATVNEHWGIVVAEALARRLPVAVHRSGGAWTDIAEEGRNGLGYGDADEAVEALAKLLTDGGAWRNYSSSRRVRDLTLDSYARRLGELVRTAS